MTEAIEVTVRLTLRVKRLEPLETVTAPETAWAVSQALARVTVSDTAMVKIVDSSVATRTEGKY